jgi:hypothetical protein
MAKKIHVAREMKTVEMAKEMNSSNGTPRSAV